MAAKGPQQRKTSRDPSMRDQPLSPGVHTINISSDSNSKGKWCPKQWDILTTRGWEGREAERRGRRWNRGCCITRPLRDICEPPQGLRKSVGTEQSMEQASAPQQESARLIVSLFCHCIAAPETKTITFFQDQEFTEQKC